MTLLVGLYESRRKSRFDQSEFFSETAVPLDFAIRSIVGLDPESVAARFAEFARRHPKLTAKQTRFLGLLQNHIARFGSVTLDRLYEQPFTVVDADGLDGVFEKPEEIDDLLDILSIYEPPMGTRPKDEKPEGTRASY
jgi:type I restriction enzyme R subunit